MSRVFIAGATGFMGRRLSAELVRRGHFVRALARPGSEQRVSQGCEVVAGDPLRPESYADRVAGCDTFVHLVGVAHPSPAKAAQFRSIDLASAKASLANAVRAGVGHFVYVSVAHPAPVMRAYIEARSEAEAAVRASGLNATVLRPWYVLGPGRRWPVLLLPIYWVFGLLPRTREAALRLGLVTDRQMVAALTDAVERPANGVRVMEVPEIRHGGLRGTPPRASPGGPLQR